MDFPRHQVLRSTSGFFSVFVLTMGTRPYFFRGKICPSTRLFPFCTWNTTPGQKSILLFSAMPKAIGTNEGCIKSSRQGHSYIASVAKAQSTSHSLAAVRYEFEGFASDNAAAHLTITTPKQHSSRKKNSEEAYHVAEQDLSHDVTLRPTSHRNKQRRLKPNRCTPKATASDAHVMKRR